LGHYKNEEIMETKTEEKVTKFKVEDLDVVLIDYRVGQGKIMIAGNGVSGSYFWGAMGGRLVDFISRIDVNYFSKNVLGDLYVFCGKTSAKNVRAYFRQNWSWYKDVEFSKELARVLQSAAGTRDEYDFERVIRGLLLESPEDDDVAEHIGYVTDYWYEFIGRKDSREYRYIQKIFPKLQRHCRMVACNELIEYISTLGRRFF